MNVIFGALLLDLCCSACQGLQRFLASWDRRVGLGGVWDMGLQSKSRWTSRCKFVMLAILSWVAVKELELNCHLNVRKQPKQVV